MEEGPSLTPVRSLFVLLAALAVVVVGCATRSYYGIVSSGKLICGTKFDVSGFGFRTRTRAGRGLDADLCREIANDNNVRPEFVKASGEDRIPLLNEGKIDIIISTMQVTDEGRRRLTSAMPTTSPASRSS
jgi:ABC-type amino acid transport substrate-binding protein